MTRERAWIREGKRPKAIAQNPSHEIRGGWSASWEKYAKRLSASKASLREYGARGPEHPAIRLVFAANA